MDGGVQTFGQIYPCVPQNDFRLRFIPLFPKKFMDIVLHTRCIPAWT